MSKTYRLKDDHPTMQKLRQLSQKAEDLGLSIDGEVVEDRDFPDVVFRLRGIDGENMSGLPLYLEYSLVFWANQDQKDWYDMVYKSLKSRGFGQSFIDGDGI
jgi:hypothetical protein